MSSTSNVNVQKPKLERQTAVSLPPLMPKATITAYKAEITGTYDEKESREFYGKMHNKKVNQ